MQLDTTTQYDIPLSHLDYQYIDTCSKVKELEKILKALRYGITSAHYFRSGTEGRFPDLERHCEEKIRSLHPNRCAHQVNHFLSVEHARFFSTDLLDFLFVFFYQCRCTIKPILSVDTAKE